MIVCTILIEVDRELKHEPFLSYERQLEVVSKPKNVTPHRPQMADVKTEVLPSVMKLHKCEKITRF